MPTIIIKPDNLMTLTKQELGYQIFDLREKNWLFETSDQDTFFYDIDRSSIQINGQNFKDSTEFDANLNKAEKSAVRESWIKRSLFNSNDAAYEKLYPLLRKFYRQAVGGYFYPQMMAAAMKYYFIDPAVTVGFQKNSSACELSCQAGVIRVRSSHEGFLVKYSVAGVMQDYQIPGSLMECYVLTEQGFKLESIECSNPLIAELATKNFVNCRVWMDAVATEQDKEAALWKQAQHLLAATRDEQEKVSALVVAENEAINARRAQRQALKANINRRALEPIAPTKNRKARTIEDDYRLLDRSLRSYLHYLISKVGHHLTPSYPGVALQLMFDRGFLMKPSHALSEEEKVSRDEFMKIILPTLKNAEQPIAAKLQLIVALRDTLHTKDLAIEERIANAKAYLTPVNRVLLNQHRDRFSRFFEKVLRTVFPNRFVDQHLRLFQSKGERRVLKLLTLNNEPERKDKARRELKQ